MTNCQQLVRPDASYATGIQRQNLFGVRRRHYFALTDLGINNNNRASVLLSLKKWKRKRKKKRINICEDTFNDYTQCHTETDNIAFGARHR